MDMLADVYLFRLLSGVVGLLVVASVVGFLLDRNVTDGTKRTAINNLNTRIRACWVMSAIFAVAVFSGIIGALILFALLSFLALREFITLVPSNRGDQRTLIWVFFV